MRHTAVLVCVLCGLLFLLPCSLAAQTAFDPAARAAVIAPFVDEQTVAVARVDVERIDPAAVVKLLSEVSPAGAPELPRQLAQIEQALKAMKTMLRGGGISEVYAIVSLQDIPKEPAVLVAPFKTGVNAAEAAAILKELTRLPAAEPIGQVVVAGSPAVIARLKSQRPAPRPDLSRALALAGDTTAQAILAPTEDTRRAIREMLPRLPEEIGGGSGHALADGVQWAVLSVNAPPKLSLSMTVQSKDEASAAALRGVAVNLIQKVRDQLAGASVRPDERSAAEAVLRLVTPQLKGNQLVISHVQDDQDVKTLLRAVVPALHAARTAAGRSQSTNNLKQTALAIHGYHDVYNHMPPQAIRNKEGKPLLSWRVAILPYLGQKELYDQFKLDEPWDSAHNKSLIARLPPALASPHLGNELIAQGKTSYLVPLSKAPPAVAVIEKDDPKAPVKHGKDEMIFDLPQGTTFARILDGSSNTILVVEVHRDSAVIWTKPDDLVIDVQDPLKALKGQPSNGFSAALADGSVRFISNSVDLKLLLNLLQMNDGNPVSLP
jgi:hypothetical protein